MILSMIVKKIHCHLHSYSAVQQILSDSLNNRIPKEYIHVLDQNLICVNSILQFYLSQSVTTPNLAMGS